MTQCVVIADDLTGGNATGVLLKQLNYRAITVLNTDNFKPEFLDSCDCVIYPTDSRAMSPEDAYKVVYDSTKLLASRRSRFIPSALIVLCAAMWAWRLMPCSIA